MRTILLALAVLGTADPGHARRGPCGAGSDDPGTPRLAVLSAFPAELAPLVAATVVDERVEVDGRAFYLGRLEGVRVVLGLLGIGMVNAATTTESVLRTFAPAAVIVSGVAGSPHRIGDVVVADAWADDSGGTPVQANPAALALVRRAARGLPPLDACTTIPPSDPAGTLRCLAFTPVPIAGGTGHSADPFGGQPLACVPGGDEVFGCELPVVATTTVPFVAEDMESTAVARVAATRGVPFAAVRGVSDGAGDPLGDRGFPAQFFDYYGLAARNAARLAVAMVSELGTLPVTRRGRRVCRLLARRRWHRAARAIDALTPLPETTVARARAASP